MKTYTMLMHPNEPSAVKREAVKEFIRTHGMVGLHEDGSGAKAFISNAGNSPSCGDIVLVRAEGRPLVLVRLTGPAVDAPAKRQADFEWLTHVRPAVALGWWDEDKVTFGLQRLNFQGYRASFELVRDGEQLILLKWFGLIEENAMKAQILNLMKHNRQIVLTGAPGTGKTYTAKAIAEKAIKDTRVLDEHLDEKKIRMAFVQLHPSFDYTDFVEGLKPVSNNSGQITFELRNGVFKEFCRRAGLIERICFEKLHARNVGERVLTVEDINGIDVNALKPKLDGEKDKDVIGFWEKWLTNARNTKEVILPPFYFIIDEINRADLSRVFGELFYALEPHYRGVEGAVTTQYTSLNTEKTFFVNKDDDKFFIPSNVFIIGTMNDIDRSVESFDFALRRRFVWKKIKADESCFVAVMAAIASKPFYGGALNRYTLLNNAIGKDQQLGESYQIGPAYFQKLENYPGNDGFEKLWSYHLEPLIGEYLRGMPKPKYDECITKLRGAYGKDTASSAPPPEQPSDK